MAVYMLAQQIRKGVAVVENEYARVVRYEGNQKALTTLNTVFTPYDVDWRGFPVIPGSGMKMKSEFSQFDARRVYEDELRDLNRELLVEPQGCRCGEVLRGLIDSTDCPLFATSCTPTYPIGPCMVSVEGSCNIEYKYNLQKEYAQK
jgi:hydrogenase expression/formation protein HypD